MRNYRLMHIPTCFPFTRRHENIQWGVDPIQYEIRRLQQCFHDYTFPIIPFCTILRIPFPSIHEAYRRSIAKPDVTPILNLIQIRHAYSPINNFFLTSFKHFNFNG